MASGLDMLYNAIGGAGSTLSGHLRESELRRLQVEAELRAQAERDAFLEESKRVMSGIDKEYADRTAQAQELGVQVPTPGTIDDQIFRATGGFARSPSLSQPGTPMAPGGGTQLPAATPRTEWAPSQAEAAVSADAIRANKDLLTGRSAIDTSRYLKRLEAINGLQRSAASRPSTKDMVGALNDQAKGYSDFMTREGAIANDGRQLQGSIAGRFMDNRALSARERQGTEYVQGQTNARNEADNASRERTAAADRIAKEKAAARMEDKETRLQQGPVRDRYKLVRSDIKSAQDEIKIAQADEASVVSEDMDIDAFEKKYPHAKVTKAYPWSDRVIEKSAVKDETVQKLQEDMIKAQYLEQYLADSEIELAKRTGTASATPENAAIRAAAGNSGGFSGVPPVSASPLPLKNLNKTRKTLEGI